MIEEDGIWTHMCAKHNGLAVHRLNTQPLWKTIWDFLKKLKIELPFHQEIPLLGLYPKNPETSIQKNLYTPMLIAAHYNSQVLEAA